MGTEFYADELVTLHLGDCVEVMAGMDAESVDAIVTDPPYNLGFMGKAWDYRHQHEPWAREAYRVAKPGGYLLAFGGTRTYHRLASAIEDAGFEIRDCLVWAYASGFPKSLDVSKAIDKAAGVERERIPGGQGGHNEILGARQAGVAISDDAITDAAKRWQGWGTALKPAWEPIVMARKPLQGTVAANVTTYGTGALNIDGTRIPGAVRQVTQGVGDPTSWSPRQEANESQPHENGRWPANLILTDPLFDGGVDGVVGGGQQTSTAAPGAWQPRGAFPIDNPEPTIYGDTGTYSRFFLIPKAARSDREPLVRGESNGVWSDGRDKPADYPSQRGQTVRANVHPTVKPVELMRHLVRLVTPPGGTVLDCFLGSGSTAIAANMEGFRCIGIEREAEYLEIARARMAHQRIGMGL